VTTISKKVFVGNLSYDVTREELLETFGAAGKVVDAKVPTDRETGRPRGFAFVDYADRAVAEEAIRRFNQQPFKGRPLAVSEARPREDRPAGPRPGGFSGPRPGGPGGGGFSSPRPGGFSAPRPGGFTGTRPSDPNVPTSRSRNFGPDAPPKNKRKPQRKDSDRGPRGPIKERPVGRLYDADEDWRAADEEVVEVDNIATSKEDGDVGDDES
jgi:cold-inducible RNA-binding protein